MSPEERVNRAHDLSLSALLGANIYNFGELVGSTLCTLFADLTIPQLMHPLLGSLDNTPHSWLKNLLFVFNEGNIGKFEAIAPLFPKEVRLSFQLSTKL